MTESKHVDAPARVLTPLDMLRNATSEYHRQLEAAIDWMGAFQSYATYRDLLGRFGRVVPPLEQTLAQQLAGASPPGFEPNVRTRWLASDLAALISLMAASEPRASDCAAVAASCDALRSASAEAFSSDDFAYIDNAASAIGALYVLEGSSLGGQFLVRQLSNRLQLTASQGGAYFAGYGPATARHWQAFRDWANLQLFDSRSTEQAADAAKLTFARFGKALAGLAYE